MVGKFQKEKEMKKVSVYTKDGVYVVGKKCRSKNEIESYLEIYREKYPFYDVVEVDIDYSRACTWFSELNFGLINELCGLVFGKHAFTLTRDEIYSLWEMAKSPRTVDNEDIKKLIKITRPKLIKI